MKRALLPLLYYRWGTQDSQSEEAVTELSAGKWWSLAETNSRTRDLANSRTRAYLTEFMSSRLSCQFICTCMKLIKLQEKMGRARDFPLRLVIHHLK